MTKLVDIEALRAYNNNVDSRLVKLENVTNVGLITDYISSTDITKDVVSFDGTDYNVTELTRNDNSPIFSDISYTIETPLNILDTKWSDVLLDSIAWLRSNQQWNDGTVYPTVFEILTKEYQSATEVTEDNITIKKASNNRCFCSSEDYDTCIANTNSCKYYVLDIENNRFKLPFLNGYLRYGNESKFVDQSLPNIKGNIAFTCTSGDDNTSGVFSKTSSSNYGANFGPASAAKFTFNSFDASRSSSIYTDNANVEVNSFQGYLYFYVGDQVRNIGVIDVSNLTDTVTNKADRTEISSLSYPSSKCINLTVPTSGTNIQAIANGYLQMWLTPAGTNISNYVFLLNKTSSIKTVCTRDIAIRGVYAYLPVRKDDSVYIEYNTVGCSVYLTFTYASDQE